MLEQKEAKPWAIWQTAMLLALAAALALGGMGWNWYEGKQAVPCLAAADQTKYVIPVGQTVGIKLFSRGVMVVGLSDVTTQEGESSPARQCGLRTGDIITHIDGCQVDTIEEVQTILQNTSGETMSIQLTRNGRMVETETAAVQCMTDGTYRLGAWIRDSMAGIGTVTYYDPSTGKFAALGHGVNDIDTGMLMPLESGAVMPSSVTDVQVGVRGTPGELHGEFEVDQDCGTLYANTGCGIFGVTGKDTFSGEAYPVAEISEVKVGPATILANVDGTAVKEYEVEVLRVYRCTGQDSRSMMVHVTDEELLARTGGIVQGMSGSPILQNGKLIGAVTHVLCNDPTCGYGIFAETMLEASE